MPTLTRLFLCLIFFAGHAFAKEKIIVFAAASLTNALQTIAQDYQQQHPDVEIMFSFASSSTLAKQIQYGAPADVFISANTDWMSHLQHQQLIEPNTERHLLHNTLVLVTAKNSPLAALTLDLSQNTPRNWPVWLENSKLALGDPDYVPAGIYAKQALTHLGDWQTVAPLIAPTNNVRSALVLVERQEAALGIVYYSDTLASDHIQILATFPAHSHSPITYPIAIVKNHASQTVRDFYSALFQSTAAHVFRQNGFQVIEHVN